MFERTIFLDNEKPGSQYSCTPADEDMANVRVVCPEEYAEPGRGRDSGVSLLYSKATHRN